MSPRLFVLFGLVFWAGCESSQYEVEITPKGDTFERQITAWRNQSGMEPRVTSLGSEELTSIASAYHQDVPAPVDQKHTFRGTFTERTPADVGGYGTLTRYDSPCGSFAVYLERFRGSDDLLGEVERRSKRIDEAVDLLVAWLEADVGQMADFPKLRDFVGVELRRDLKNVSLYAYTLGFGFGETDKVKQEMGARVVQYLLERKYITPAETPHLLRAISDANERENPRPLGELLVRVVARKMGRAEGAEPPAEIAFLADPEKAQASLAKFLRGTDAFKRYESEKKKESSSGEVDPLVVVQDPLGRAFVPNGIFSPADQVSVTLATPCEPFKTNGAWEAAQSRVVWHSSLETNDVDAHEIPRLFFALWAEPNAAYQSEHFGRVLLEGEELAQYCLWYKGLSPNEATQWNAFVNALKPGNNLRQSLADFRFADEKPDVKAGHTVASPALELLRSKLDGQGD